MPNDDIEKLPPIKLDPHFGYFPRWPEDGDAWLHPDDVELARGLLPSHFIWRKDRTHNESGDGFDTLRYAGHTLRVRPAMWQEVPAPQFAIGDLVEVLPHGLQNDAQTGHVTQVFWDESATAIRYKLEVTDRLVDCAYAAEDLKHVEAPIKERLFRIEPSGDDDGLELMGEG